MAAPPATHPEVINYDRTRLALERATTLQLVVFIDSFDYMVNGGREYSERPHVNYQRVVIPLYILVTTTATINRATSA